MELEKMMTQYKVQISKIHRDYLGVKDGDIVIISDEKIRSERALIIKKKQNLESLFP